MSNVSPDDASTPLLAETPDGKTASSPTTDGTSAITNLTWNEYRDYYDDIYVDVYGVAEQGPASVSIADDGARAATVVESGARGVTVLDDGKDSAGVH